MPKIAFYFLFFISISAFTQTTYTITDPEDINSLSATLLAGDTVILADGDYSSDKRVKFSPSKGTAALPITFRAATPGGVKFTGGLQMSIGGDYVVVDGFHWQGGYGASNFIEFRDGDNYANYSKIQNCAIDGLEISPDDKVSDGTTSITKHRWVVLYGTYNTVINCSFMNKASAGALILVELEYNASPDDGATNTRCNSVGHTITNNYFYKYEKIDATLSNAGDSETIRVGTSEYQNVDSSTTVSNNYFVEADGENEIITNKSKNNSYINNTFRRCRGSLVLRHGSDAIVNGNYFLGENVEGTGGIRIVDSEHMITNNYIQDCINVNSQAKWNNGITFLGGSSNNSVLCTATSTSNGYQKVENINLSNNTIINTNAPLYYNIDKGATDPTGLVSNNLIYFTASNPNITNLITGDTANSYSNLGTKLTYSGNVYTGTSLGETNSGFSEEPEIVATEDGEIFSFSGDASSNKGADMGSYRPTTNDMVGYGIGACFLNNLGNKITNGDCSIVVPESLTISALPTLESNAASYDVSVNANVSWTAVSNDSWISIDTNSANGDATVAVTITENTTTESRTGTITFTQDSGGDDIERILTITQNGVSLINLYTLINTGASNDPVTIHSFSKEEVGGSKTNAASNTLDKDNNTVWAADDGAVLADDYKGDGEYIIYDLGSNYDLKLVQFSTTNKADAFGFQIWVSTTGTNVSDFSKVLPTSGDLILSATNTTDFNQVEITTNVTARFVKLIGFGRFNTAGDTRKSVWSAVGEIEFFSTSSLSINNLNIKDNITFYPMPVSDFLFIENLNKDLKQIEIYNVDGRRILKKNISSSEHKVSLNVSSLENGIYILRFYDGLNLVSKKILVSH